MSLILAENPGLVTVVKLPVIEKVRDKYFATAFAAFGHQTIPDVSSGDLHVSNIRVDMANTSPANLKISFQQPKNALGVEIDQTSLEVNVDWKYKKSIISVSGDAKITGTLGAIGMNLGLTTMAKDPFVIPQISVQDFILNMDKGAFSLDFHCNHCPGEVEKLIANFLKDTLIDQVRDQIQSQVPSQLNSVGNQILSDSYPTTFNLYNDIDIATGMTAQVTVAEDHIEIPMDATVFPTEQGYKRSGTTPAMPTYNPNDPGAIMMFFNPYLVSTLSDTINASVQKYSATLMGIQYEVSLDPAVGKTVLSFEDTDMVIVASPSITATQYGIGLQLAATAKLDPKILNGDAINMFSVVPKVKALSLSSLKIVYGQDTYDLSFAVNYLNAVIQGMLNQLVIPTVAIPKQDILPLHVTNSELDFHTDYTEFGILFDFGRK